MATRTNDKRATVHNLVADILSDYGVELLRKRDALKAELKLVDDEARLLIENGIAKYGVGVHAVNSHLNIELKQTERASVSWKNLAYAVATEDAINDQLPTFTETTVINSAKVVQ